MYVWTEDLLVALCLLSTVHCIAVTCSTIRFLSHTLVGHHPLQLFCSVIICLLRLYLVCICRLVLLPARASIAVLWFWGHVLIAAVATVSPHGAASGYPVDYDT